jgi:hypothetical protein
MYLLSVQAREMIREAVDALPDAERRQIWFTWSHQHPRLLLPGGPDCDDEPPLPAAVAVVVLTAPKLTEDSKRSFRASAEMSEDDRSDLDNEITYIGAVTRLVQQAARPQPSPNLITA